MRVWDVLRSQITETKKESSSVMEQHQPDD